MKKLFFLTMLVTSFLFTNLALSQTNDAGVPIMLPAPNQLKGGCCPTAIPAQQAGLTSAKLTSELFRPTVFWDASANEYRYKLSFTPTNQLNTILEAHSTYVKALYPCATNVGIGFFLYDVTNVVGHPNNRHIAVAVFKKILPGGNIGIEPNTPVAFTDYFATPGFQSAMGGSPNNNLSYNKQYKIMIGMWIDGCPGNPDTKCADFVVMRKFEIRTSAKINKATSTPETKLILFDDNDKVISETAINVSAQK